MTIVVSDLLSIMPNLKRHEPVELGVACYLIAVLGTIGLNEGVPAALDCEIYADN